MVAVVDPAANDCARGECRHDGCVGRTLNARLRYEREGSLYAKKLQQPVDLRCSQFHPKIEIVEAGKTALPEHRTIQESLSCTRREQIQRRIAQLPMEVQIRTRSDDRQLIRQFSLGELSIDCRRRGLWWGIGTGRGGGIADACGCNNESAQERTQGKGPDVHEYLPEPRRRHAPIARACPLPARDPSHSQDTLDGLPVSDLWLPAQ